MAIQNITDAPGFTPLEAPQEAPAPVVTAGSSPAAPSGGDLTATPQTIVPGGALRAPAEGPRPTSQPVDTGLGETLGNLLGSLPEEEPKVVEPPEFTPPDDVIDGVGTPSQVDISVATPEGPSTEPYKSVLGGIVASRVDNTYSVETLPDINPVDTPAGPYRSVLSGIVNTPGTSAPPVRTASLAPVRGTPSASSRNPMIRYSNQGATRSQPVSRKMETSLSFLQDMGIEMEVFSGGQPDKGTSSKRVGSTRHDHGDAADVFFYKDGKKLDWSKKEDVPVFQEIVRRGRAAGLTGFGAGQGYMQQGSMHIGFGSPAVWGAGGRGSNAPQWLKDAFGG